MWYYTHRIADQHLCIFATFTPNTRFHVLYLLKFNLLSNPEDSFWRIWHMCCTIITCIIKVSDLYKHMLVIDAIQVSFLCPLNFEEVEGAYKFGSVCAVVWCAVVCSLSVCLSVIRE